MTAWPVLGAGAEVKGQQSKGAQVPLWDWLRWAAEREWGEHVPDAQMCVGLRGHNDCGLCVPEVRYRVDEKCPAHVKHVGCAQAQGTRAVVMCEKQGYDRE